MRNNEFQRKASKGREQKQTHTHRHTHTHTYTHTHEIHADTDHSKGGVGKDGDRSDGEAKASRGICHQLQHVHSHHGT